MDKPKKKFYDLDIQSNLSSGESSVREIIEFGEKLNFAGLAISDYAVEMKDLKKLEGKISEVDTNIDVRTGVKIKSGKIKDLKDKLRLFRKKAGVIVVSGGSVDINRAACEDAQVDILAHPSLNRKDSGIDHIMAKEASNNNVAIQININQLLQTRGKERSHILSHNEKNIMLAHKYGAPVVCSSGAPSVYEMKGPRELASFSYILGMKIQDALKTVSTVPRTILEKSEEKRSSNYVQSGVKKE